MHIERAESVGNGSNRVHHFGMESTLLAIGHVAFLDRRLLAGNDLFFGGAEVEYDDKAPQGLFGAALTLPSTVILVWSRTALVSRIRTSGRFCFCATAADSRNMASTVAPKSLMEASVTGGRVGLPGRSRLARRVRGTLATAIKWRLLTPVLEKTNHLCTRNRH